VEAITEVEVGVEPGAGEAGQPPEYKEWQQYFDSGQQAYEQGDYAAAERNLEQARPRAEALPEKYWLQRVLTLHYLGRTQFSQKKYPEAGRWFERELTLLEENRTPDQPETAQALRALGELYQAVDEPAKSESYYLRAIPLLEHLLDETAMEETRWSYARQLARTLAQLGVIYQEQARQGPAERAFRRAVAIAEKTPDVDELVFSLHHYAKLLRQVGREEEAAAVEARLLSLRVTAPK
jgi:tetratricopeptide (TPR) repeat protein